jgi:hypothetical protein
MLFGQKSKQKWISQCVKQSLFHCTLKHLPLGKQFWTTDGGDITVFCSVPYDILNLLLQFTDNLKQLIFKLLYCIFSRINKCVWKKELVLVPGARCRSWSLGSWDRGFKSCLRHGHLSFFCVVLSCVGRGLALSWYYIQEPYKLFKLFIISENNSELEQVTRSNLYSWGREEKELVLATSIPPTYMTSLTIEVKLFLTCHNAPGKT